MVQTKGREKMSVKMLWNIVLLFLRLWSILEADMKVVAKRNWIIDIEFQRD